MKNIIISFIFLYIIIIFSFNGIILGEDEDESNKILNEIHVHTFTDAGGNYSIDLEFKNDFTYEFNFNHEGTYWHNQGTFQIKKNLLELKPKICKERNNHTQSISCNQTFGFGICKIIDNSDDLFVDKFLVCISNSNRHAFDLSDKPNEHKFPLYKYPTKPGKIVNYERTPLLLLKIKSITLTNVKIREKPDIKSKTKKYLIDSENDKYLDYVPKDTEVYIIGRTTNIHQIKEWNNYWYLVNVKENYYVWIYGEFLKSGE